MGDAAPSHDASHSEYRSDGMMTREGMAGEVGAVRSGDPALPVRGRGGGLCSLSRNPCSSSIKTWACSA